MQAQDYAMAKWAIGVRLANATDQAIETAINNAEIIRTHLLRFTWHFVSANDVYWMLELTAPHIKASLKSRHRELGLDETIVAKSNAVIKRALRGGKQLTRAELIAKLAQAKIATDDNRASHLLGCAELDGIACSGATRNGKQTYALLAERVPKTKSLTREQALAKLGTIYFTSHGPATSQDFVWWSGLTVGDAKRALEMVKADFVTEKIGAQTFWFTHISKTDEKAVYLLPAFDEFLISYSDRSASLADEHVRRAVSSNGIFRPVIVVNGQVAGLWKRTIKKDTVIVEAEFFKQPDKTTKRLVEQAVFRYGRFQGKITEIHYKV